jgi:ComF family protein
MDAFNVRNRALGLARSLGMGAADLLFPPLCVGCEDRLPAVPPALPLCAACRRTLPHAPQDALDERLSRMGDEASIIDHRLALWTFDDGGVLQSLQHALKYRDRPGLGVRLGAEVGRLWRSRGYPIPDRIAPVPLARLRFLERGYNQAERVAAGIADALGAPVDELVKRARATSSQTRLSREARRKNVEGAFAMEGADGLEGVRVLLVDDVLTTGATLLSAATPLHQAGATVDLAVLALTRE